MNFSNWNPTSLKLTHTLSTWSACGLKTRFGQLRVGVFMGILFALTMIVKDGTTVWIEAWRKEISHSIFYLPCYLRKPKGVNRQCKLVKEKKPWRLQSKKTKNVQVVCFPCGKGIGRNNHCPTLRWLCTTVWPELKTMNCERH